MYAKEVKKLKTEHQVAFALIAAFAIIAFWKGVWGLMDELVYPANPQLSYSLSLVLGLVILIISGYVTKERI